VDAFLEELNRKIRDEVYKDAEINRAFLEAQIVATHDPLIREKIQHMIAVEIEKAMLVGSKSFDVLEKPVVPLYRLRPKRKKIMVLSVILGFFLAGFGAVVWEGIPRRGPPTGGSTPEAKGSGRPSAGLSGDKAEAGRLSER
jgi:LPS O-antigen subunit length determinant protein (WzzB/FepE family)